MCTTSATHVQLASLERLELAAARLVQKNAAEGGTIPRVPYHNWGLELQHARISYQGEVVQTAERLTLEEVAPAVPPDGFGGRH